MPPLHWTDFIAVGNLLVLLGIYHKISVMLYQHQLMWKDFARRKGIAAETSNKISASD